MPIKRLLPFLFVLLSCACAPAAFARKLEYAMPPATPVAGPLSFKVSDPVPPSADAPPKRGLMVASETRWLDDAHRVFYSHPFGGGGVAVGLLFGAIGAGVNAAAIQHANEVEANALRGTLRLDPKALLARAIAARGDQGAAVTEATLVPTLFVTRDAQERLIFWPVLDVTIGDWKSRYNALSQGRVPLADAVKGLPADQQVNLEWAIQSAYARALDALAADATGQLTGFGPQTIDISALAPRNHKPIRYQQVLKLEDRVILRGLDASNVVPGVSGFFGVVIVPMDSAKF